MFHRGFELNTSWANLRPAAASSKNCESGGCRQGNRTITGIEGNGNTGADPPHSQRYYTRAEVSFLRHKTPTSPLPVSKSEVGSGTTVAVPVKEVSVPRTSPTPGSGKKKVPVP